MTFNSAAWAINGPLTSASLARRAQYAASGGNQGVVLATDLKVLPLDVPGVGIQISPGSALVLNGYQGSNINETYTVANEGPHIIPSSDMPASSPSARSYLVAIVVGDPDFSQGGHPWMLSQIPDGQESSFVYVRPTLIPVSAGATTAPAGYPALPLARLDIPANTTTITSAMIVDLRKLANPRSTGDVRTFRPAARIDLVTTSFTEWPTSNAQQVFVPAWANRFTITAVISGINHFSGNITGNIRLTFGTMSGASALYNADSAADSTRETLAVASSGSVPANFRGTTQTISLQGTRNNTSGNVGWLSADNGTSLVFMINFYEE